MNDINILDDPQFKEFVRAKDYKPKSVRNYKNGMGTLPGRMDIRTRFTAIQASYYNMNIDVMKKEYTDPLSFYLTTLIKVHKR